jgi:hypothetical protein
MSTISEIAKTFSDLGSNFFYFESTPKDKCLFSVQLIHQDALNTFCQIVIQDSCNAKFRLFFEKISNGTIDSRIQNISTNRFSLWPSQFTVKPSAKEAVESKTDKSAIPEEDWVLI